MKRIAFLFVFMIIAFSSLNAKSYPFDMAHSYEVQIVRVAQQGTKFLKAWVVTLDKTIVHTPSFLRNNHDNRFHGLRLIGCGLSKG